MKTSFEHLLAMKDRGEKITMLTCYDYPTALWQEAAGVKVIFVGDSVGRNVLGYESEREVTMDDMLHHLKAVRRGVQDAYLLADMPFGSYDTPQAALDNALRFVSLGADGVKLEGAREDVVVALAERGLDVCGHLGLTPQIHERMRLQARTADAAIRVLRDALAMERAGAGLLVLELVPEEVGRLITERLTIPTIGIGAGAFTDGQVLVVNDLLGFIAYNLRHLTQYEDLNGRSRGALAHWVQDVEAGAFPGEGHARHLAEDEMAELEALAADIP